jgi:hypothetical protein
MSEYENVVQGTAKRGRKPLPAEEKQRRVELQKEQNRLRQEARRRAALVLQHRYSEEFSGLCSIELTSLKNSKNKINN